VGRAIVDLALTQDARRSTRLHGVATELRRRQTQYYDALNQAQRGNGEVTAWLEWFIGVYAESCRTTVALIDEALVRARFWSDHQQLALNARQRKALNKMLEPGPGRFEGGLTLRQYVGMTGASRATAWRDINDLLGKNLILPGGVGRATYYNLAIPGWAWREESGRALRR
jgi:Fic family protein